MFALPTLEIGFLRPADERPDMPVPNAATPDSTNTTPEFTLALPDTVPLEMNEASTTRTHPLGSEKAVGDKTFQPTSQSSAPEHAAPIATITVPAQPNAVEIAQTPAEVAIPPKHGLPLQSHAQPVFVASQRPEPIFRASEGPTVPEPEKAFKNAPFAGLQSPVAGRLNPNFPDIPSGTTEALGPKTVQFSQGRNLPHGAYPSGNHVQNSVGPYPVKAAHPHTNGHAVADGPVNQSTEAPRQAPHMQVATARALGTSEIAATVRQTVHVPAKSIAIGPQEVGQQGQTRPLVQAPAVDAGSVPLSPPNGKIQTQMPANAWINPKFAGTAGTPLDLPAASIGTPDSEPVRQPLLSTPNAAPRTGADLSPPIKINASAPSLTVDTTANILPVGEAEETVFRLDRSDASIARTLPTILGGAPPTVGGNFSANNMALSQSIVRQILDASPAALSQGAVEITLDPVELGKVRLSLSAIEGAMTMVVSADRAETIELMRRNSDALFLQMKDAGFERLDLSFAQSDRNADQNENDEFASERKETLPQPADTSANVTRLNVSLGTDGLDIRL